MNNITASGSERIYALDALRSIMMLLGIVIHAGLTYSTLNYWNFQDPNNSSVFSLVVVFIHSFRMPVFFIAAGYFAALLFYRKGPIAMLSNRFNRILLPFLAGVLIIYPMVVFSFTFSKAAFQGADAPLRSAWEAIVSGKFLPFKAAHLWFLYFLAMYAFAGWLLASLFKRNTVLTASVNKLFGFLIQTVWLRLAAMALLLFICLFWMGSTHILTSDRWKANPAVFVTYLVFFGIGWMCYKTNTLNHLIAHPIWQLSIGSFLFLVSSFNTWPSAPWVVPVQMMFTAVYSSLFIFGFIAFFLGYFNHYSPRLNYLMEASYWVYLIHLPIVTFIPGLMAGLSLPAFVKFTITLSVTTFLCMMSYKYWVRASFVGKFLNGKVHKRKKQVRQAKDVLIPS